MFDLINLFPHRDGSVIMTTIVVTVPMKANFAMPNIRHARHKSLPARISNAFEINIAAMVSRIMELNSSFPIYILKFASGEDDCGDRSDESGCNKKGNTTCATGQFTCTNGQCIEMHLVCNKVADCTDESDEPLHCHVDECAKVEIHQCGHKCVDTLTSYYCDCNQGYK